LDASVDDWTFGSVRKRTALRRRSDRSDRSPVGWREDEGSMVRDAAGRG
jgi:hypothetical protein